MKRLLAFLAAGVLLVLLTGGAPLAQVDEETMYNPGHLKPVDSELNVEVGQPAPDFTLPNINGEMVSLSDFRGRNVVLSFVPAAFTPVCSDQWPGYNLARPIFEKYDAVLIGISADNVPSLHAWTHELGDMWFPVLSDFWPHGNTAREYGVLRSDGTCERAIVIIDRGGIIRYLSVSDINRRPDLGVLAEELSKLD